MMETLTQWLGSPERATYAIWAGIALVALVALFILITIIRMLMRGRLNMSRSDRRNRMPRLGVTDFFDLDKEGRRLVIVRRDNVEHLLMIGGPNNDVLVESNIVRGRSPELPQGAVENGSRPVVPTRNEAAQEPAPAPAPMPTPMPAPMPQPVAASAPQTPRPVQPAPQPVSAAPRPVPAPMPQPIAPAPAPVVAPRPQAAPAVVPPLRPAQPAASLDSVTQRLNANLKSLTGAKPAEAAAAPAAETNVDLEKEMARLLGGKS